MAEQFDEARFLGYIEGDLSPKEKQEFETQLQSDARLRSLVAQMMLDRHHLRQIPHQEAPPQLMEQVHQQLERNVSVKMRPLRSPN